MNNDENEIHCYCIKCDEITRHSLFEDLSHSDSNLICSVCGDTTQTKLSEEDGIKSDEAYKRFIAKHGIPEERKIFDQTVSSPISPYFRTMSGYIDPYQFVGSPYVKDHFLRSKSSNGTFKRDQPKIGRNDKCSCGSGKKNKNCCNTK